ncbi:hypothetical protein MN116_009047 [Schistosoma mekongi]|uniref:Fucosyltransferase n=1 Tax=Schistosoma mekongi TaxID=38744 RepID=A0AAE1Z5E0_SCHME|nr:hypothetical protein MN116_009047 [Schistosoma mekongi]
MNMLESDNPTKHEVKYSFKLKVIYSILIIVTFMWLVNVWSHITRCIQHQDDYATSSETVKLVYKNVSTSNQLGVDFASALQNIYSPMIRSPVQKYSMKFSLEEGRLMRIYDSLIGNKPVKKILNYGNRPIYTPMNFSQCYASSCTFITDKEKWYEADAIVLTDDNLPDKKRPFGQLWFMLIHESAVHATIADALKNDVNYTISFRSDSTIYSPYGYYEAYVRHHGPETRYPLPNRNFAVGRSRKVAWFVSNCLPKSPRMQYASKLSQYISVDIYGTCGTLTCSKDNSTNTQTNDCLKMIRENYKFYLSFENSLCREYITEKLYRNALNHTTIVEKKCRFRIKHIIFIIFTALFIIWLINAASSIISRNSDERNYKLSSETVEWIYTNISASNQSHFNLASTLNNIYSPNTQTSVQKYSLRFSLEEIRLQRLYDSLSGNKTIKKFLNYGHRTIFTPMDFSNCHATKCTVINDMKRWREADAIILTEDKLPDGTRPHGQLWFTLIHESPVHIALAGSLVNEVNFTISYRLDSTIYSPYGSYQPFVKHDGPETRYPLPSRNFAVGKSRRCMNDIEELQYASHKQWT